MKNMAQIRHIFQENKFQSTRLLQYFLGKSGSLFFLLSYQKFDNQNLTKIFLWTVTTLSALQNWKNKTLVSS
jgi:hypothetical protein